MSLIRRLFLVGLGALLVAPALPHPALSLELSELGVVFVHGKGMWPGAFDGGIVNLLREAGAKVATPGMPWSFTRIYAASYQEGLREIDAAVADVKRQGATKIVIIGHSLGANAAIGYAARRRGLAAVVAMSPGHLPETEEMRDRTADAIVRARALAASGETSRRIWPDRIQGVPTVAMASPAAYLSMFDPDGPAVIPRNAAALQGVPLLWVVGEFDPIFARGRDYAFARAPKNARSRYIEVAAGHLAAPRVARTQVVEWLKSLW
jgi:pimeloyl-ACP methyl ester carboxylesterase